ncbi:N-formylglutamate amidohydrolase [Gluconacetobacter tumulisoli]|uniref:N-formylglutamate amidohydrolase n=1 Tax=Gluconacetobacter tumulisoli TaxID=1286189 RepID=A0A7W4K9E7_9PROT|nr:N-formylglutamate amidohydrolase [Gluconacetobacter tumulisoli]MBB2202788.1 N-formylglutamate amidohydrolase [Gluconacetobacter tumulisoli]
MLLADDEPSPVLSHNLDSDSPFFLTVDHAGRRIPRRLRQLGLREERIARHIGWDIGILAVSEIMARRLACPLLAQIYSRLVIDCNRRPGVASSIPESSETDIIPGNLGLGPQERAARERTFLRPYQHAIEACLDTRERQGTPTYLLAMHSCTPRYRDEVRTLSAGILWGPDDRFGRLVLEEVRALRPDEDIAENQPYTVDMNNDYTVPVHAEGRGLPYVEVEIRQDLISDPAGIASWADTMATAVQRAAARFESRGS